MTEPATPRRRKESRRGTAFGVAYALCFVFAVVASVAVIYTGNDTLMRFGLVFALWAALGWAFIADQSRRKAELVSAKASDYKLIYDLQLEREIAARHHYELSLEGELRRQLTAEAESVTQNALAELQQQVAVLRGQLQELLDQDLEYDQPALKARATRLDELLVARQSLGSHESLPRKRAADAQSQEEAVSPRLWLPSQSDQARREPAPQHGEQQRGEPEQEQPEAQRPQPLLQEPLLQEPLLQEPLLQEPLLQEPLLQEPPAQEPVVEQEPETQPAPEPVAEQWQQPEQPVVWQQQPEAWHQDQQRQDTPWETSATAEPQDRQTAWQQPEASPVGGGEPAPEAEQAVEYPSWYSQPTVEQVSSIYAEPSDEYPSWYSHQDAEMSHIAEPESETAVQGHEPVAEPESVAEPEPAAEHAPQPLADVAQEPEPEAATSKHDKHESEPKHQSDTSHGKAGKVKHAGKANRAKPNESRSGRRAKPVEEENAPAQAEEQDAVAAALAGAHASGHSVGELLSRLTPDEAAGYHGRRRRARMPGGAALDEDVN